MKPVLRSPTFFDARMSPARSYSGSFARTLPPFGGVSLFTPHRHPSTESYTVSITSLALGRAEACELSWTSSSVAEPAVTSGFLAMTWTRAMQCFQTGCDSAFPVVSQSSQSPRRSAARQRDSTFVSPYPDCAGCLPSHTHFPVGTTSMPTPATPNHALQRTGAAVTPAASCLRLSPAAQRSRQPRPSLSLGSLGVFPPVTSNEGF